MTRLTLLLIALGVAAAGLATKAVIREWLPVGSVRTVVDGWFNLVHVRNPGAVFGLGADLGRALPWLLTGASAIIAAVVFLTALRTPLTDRWMQVGLHLVLGGALGNIVNRVTLGPVVDFLDFYVRTANGAHHWPAFNLADVAICIGIGTLLLASRRTATSEART
ncbi:MAG TPA: signal peptidase II [Thermoanaerobaculia bacterium]|nr:signal peptidase II [Thermoanaerobaculia bacterium]